MENQPLFDTTTYPNLQQKQCSKCGVVRNFNEFRIRRASRDGLTSQCQQCLRVPMTKAHAKLLTAIQLGQVECTRCHKMVPVGKMTTKPGTKAPGSGYKRAYSTSKPTNYNIGSWCKRCRADYNNQWYHQNRMLKLKAEAEAQQAQSDTICQFTATPEYKEAFAKEYQRLELQSQAALERQPVSTQNDDSATPNSNIDNNLTNS